MTSFWKCARFVLATASLAILVWPKLREANIQDAAPSATDGDGAAPPPPFAAQTTEDLGPTTWPGQLP